MSFTIAEIAAALNASYEGDGALEAVRVAHPLDARDASDIVLATTKDLAAMLDNIQARAAIIPPGTDWRALGLEAAIFAPHPRRALAGVSGLYAHELHAPVGVHPSAVIEDGAQIGEGARIGAFTHIGAGAQIGANARILSHVSIATGAIIGDDAVIYEGARIGPRAHIGHRARIYMNAVVGADGFSFLAPQLGETPDFDEQGGYPRVHSLGGARLGDDVDVGACATIDCGTIRDTVVGSGTKIDNLAQIAHNALIGENCLICAQAGVAGSAIVGDRTILGGQSGVANHVKVARDCLVGAASSVATNLKPGSMAIGSPAWPRKEMHAILIHTRRLPKLAERVEALEKALLALEQGR